MKRVFSNTDQVIHVWAQQNQDRGRNGTSSISFEGGTLISYSTPIARICEATGTGRAVKVALHSVTKYSVTTSSQQSAARQATSHLPSFQVKYIGDIADTGGRGRAPRENSGLGWLDANMADYCKRYEEVLLQASRSRTNGERLLREAAAMREEASRFALFFKVKFDAGMFPEPDSEGAAEIKERAKAAMKAKAAATAEANKEKRKTLQATIDALVKGEDVVLPWDWYGYASQEQSAAVIAFAGRVWRETGNGIRAVSLRDMPPLLRVAGDEVVTSYGARFPVMFAKKAFIAVHHCRDTKTSWKTNGHKIPLGSFQIDEIDTSGNVRAGCHTVSWEAIAPVARHLGLLE